MNHNTVLGVAPNAPKEEIQQAFRRAALEAHPDHSDSPEAAQAFERIKQARDELMKQADQRSIVDDLQISTTAAMTATANATYQAPPEPAYSLTPEELAHIQTLDAIVANRPKRTLFGRIKETPEVRRHRHSIATTNRRIAGKY